MPGTSSWRMGSVVWREKSREDARWARGKTLAGALWLYEGVGRSQPPFFFCNPCFLRNPIHVETTQKNYSKLTTAQSTLQQNILLTSVRTPLRSRKETRTEGGRREYSYQLAWKKCGFCYVRIVRSDAPPRILTSGTFGCTVPLPRLHPSSPSVSPTPAPRPPLSEVSRHAAAPAAPVAAASSRCGGAAHRKPTGSGSWSGKMFSRYLGW